MDQRTLFHKTGRGRQVIEQRDRTLTPAQRRLLILVDGVRSVSDLAELAGGPDVENELRALWKEGYIEVEGADAELSEASSAAGCETVKRELVRQAHELLGPAGQKAVDKLRNAPEGQDEMRKALNSACKLVRLTLDEEKAETLRREGTELIERVRV